jgi:hypothetical protein
MGIFSKLMGVDDAVKNGTHSEAVIQSITDTGTTVTSPSTGPDAPVYKLGLLVTPPGGGVPYAAESKQAVPRLFIPMTLPGARIGVLVDPNNPAHVSPDWQNFNVGAGAGSVGQSGQGGMDLNFDASGRPDLGQVAALAGAVHSGTLPTHRGSAAELLATGTHGTATITSAMPLGKTVKDINPAADPATLNDPVWVLTVEVQLAGQAPFPAVFGHRIPLDKLGSVAPGVGLSVAVNPANPTQEVAIDWTKSPL